MMKLQEIIDCLTNGVGEKPYCRRIDEQMKVFVADEQEFCTIALIDEYDEPIAQAICEAGQMLKQLQAENELLRKNLLAHRADLHGASTRPCPTCRNSAEALGLSVPNQCARERWDKRALNGERVNDGS